MRAFALAGMLGCLTIVASGCQTTVDEYHKPVPVDPRRQPHHTGVLRRGDVQRGLEERPVIAADLPGGVPTAG
jgi:hypothetical protein